MNRKRPPMLRPRRRKLMIAITLSLSTILALILGEAAARILVPVAVPIVAFWPRGYYVEVPDCQYHPSVNFPKTWMRLSSPNARNLVYSNSLGMRDVEPPPPGPHQRRILCLGCSYTEGIGITSTSQPWPRVLERCLNTTAPSGAPRAVVMNGGVAGYNTFQQIAHARHLSEAARPDVWLMAYLGGSGGMYGRNAFGTSGQFGSRWGNLWFTDHLARLLAGRSSLSVWLMGKSYLWRWGCLTQTAFDPDTNRIVKSSYYSDFNKASTDALTAFRDEAVRRGIRPVLVFLPMPDEISDGMLGKASKFAFEVEKINKTLNMPFIDMTKAMAERAKRLKRGEFPYAWTVSEHDMHYNPAGNKVFAEELAPKLRAVLEEKQQAASSK